ncbi:MAG: hypothetical protein N2110_02280 [Flavobacteriales bacterium]|nr:hypothetical protein [Flavobacteriales bacterium]MCX7767837.1 hypothetical protein [Flavobacteriales bacterium]MDW8410867.1 hypothetical protein [Flavobacteriales bacterium]
MKYGIGARVRHPKFDVGIVTGGTLSTTRVFFKYEGDKEIADDFPGLTLVEEAPQPFEGLSLQDVKRALREVLLEFSEEMETVPIAEKWKGGMLVLKPGNPSLQPKEIPLQTFFHKIVLLRNRLRILEQHINSHEKLEEHEKVDLQQYITRIYGTLTTFNVLFKQKEHWFVGEGEKN